LSTIQRNPWDEVAQIYEEVRPSYPDQLIQDLIDGAHLSPNDSLLEIGAGTGKATIQLAEKGFRIHCIEPGRNLAGILAEKCSNYPNVSIDVSSFEEWTPGENTEFDLVFYAQAFDYIAPEIRYRKCHQLLKQEGHLALFWYEHKNESWESDIVSSGLFQYPQVFEYCSEFTSSAEAQTRVMESVSTFVTLDEDTKSRMRDEARRKTEQEGDFVTAHLNYKMYIAKRG
jgi:cyclopropane fatty-acyl-phospholipid synthase-like methyltransferase